MELSGLQGFKHDVDGKGNLDQKDKSTKNRHDYLLK